MIRRDKAYCFIVAKRVIKKKLPFLQIHYVSNKELFRDAIKEFAWKLCSRSKTLGLIVFDFYVGHKELKGAMKIKMPSKPLLRSQTLKSEDMDSLYSEFFVLDF